MSAALDPTVRQRDPVVIGTRQAFVPEKSDIHQRMRNTSDARNATVLLEAFFQT
jgi:hypothetical protein